MADPVAMQGRPDSGAQRDHTNMMHAPSIIAVSTSDVGYKHGLTQALDRDLRHVARCTGLISVPVPSTSIRPSPLL